MNPATVGLIAFAAILVVALFLVTYLMDRVAQLRRERDDARIDGIELRSLLRARGITPPPPPPPPPGGGRL